MRASPDKPCIVLAGSLCLGCRVPGKVSGFFTPVKEVEAQPIVLFMKKVSAHKLL
jgi:hypothetical protein